MKREEIIKIYEKCFRIPQSNSEEYSLELFVDEILALQEQPVRSADVQDELAFVHEWFYKLSCGQCSPGEVADKLHEYRNQSLKIPSEEEIENFCFKNTHGNTKMGIKWAINYITGQKI